MEIFDTIPNIIYASKVGSHIYGWNSPESDTDIHGCFAIPRSKFISIKRQKDVIESKKDDCDIVFFDMEKEFMLLLQNNCNIYEAILSPNVIKTSHHHELLKGIAKKALSSDIINSYRGLATHNYKKYIEPFTKEPSQIPAKKYLYVIRALLAGLHALEYKSIEPNIITLSKKYCCENAVEQLIDVKNKKYGTNGIDHSLMSNIIESLFSNIDVAKRETTLQTHISNDIVDEIDNLYYGLRIYYN